MRLKQTLWKTIVGGHLIAAVALAQPPTYNVIDLSVVGPNGQPFAISNNGRVAGATQVGDIIHAWLRYKSREVDLGQPGLKGQNSQAYGVNGWGKLWVKPKPTARTHKASSSAVSRHLAWHLPARPVFHSCGKTAS